MGDMDEILDGYEKKKEEEIRGREQRQAAFDQEYATRRTLFKKCADEIIMPILEEYAATLKSRGYSVKITAPLKTIPNEPELGEFYTEITFKFGNDKGLFKHFSSSIEFESAEAPNISITFTDPEGEVRQNHESTEFAIREALKSFLKKEFQS
jgi:hypothetical protein